MISFDDFLKKEKIGADTKGHSYILGDCISIKSLGEWALKIFISKAKEENTAMPFVNFLGVEVLKENIEYKIAVACLGNTEVKKRLEVSVQRSEEKSGLRKNDSPPI